MNGITFGGMAGLRLVLGLAAALVLALSAARLWEAGRRAGAAPLLAEASAAEIERMTAAARAAYLAAIELTAEPAQLRFMEKRLNELESDPKQLEKFARETYWMHRPGEEVLLVEPQDPDDSDTL